MNFKMMYLGTLLVVTAVSSGLSMSACQKSTAPITSQAHAATPSGNLPAPEGADARTSVTGTPTDRGFLPLPPVTQVPAPTVQTTGTQPVAVVQPLPTTPTSSTTQARPVVTPAANATGGVGAVIGDTSQAEPTVDDAKRLIENYYAAVNRGAYDSAHKMWAGGGQASGKSLREFTNGYSNTSNVSVTIGQPGPVEAGAGQRNIAIPVKLVARQRDQSTKEYSGTYTLGRTVVDGATAAQRAWSIRSANIDVTNN